MKIQSLAVIFVIIMLPISIIISEYTQNQIQTLKNQISYDNKLDNATYDAIKAFQLNTVNSSSSNYVNSKMRDIEASVNTFYNSVATNFDLVGYNSDIIKEYVPALVYTMYDGYYIYSPYVNHLDDETIQKIEENGGSTEYKDGEKFFGLKPYISYSCQYKKGALDVIITYSLDNYITIQGTNGNEIVNLSGYVLDNVEEMGGEIYYKGVKIEEEPMLREWVGNKEYEYIKINGAKYYLDEDGSWFSVFNGQRLKQDAVGEILGGSRNNDSAIRFYKEALKLKTAIISSGLNNLSSTDAVNVSTIKDSKGKIVYDFKNEAGKIFDYNSAGSDKSIEDPDSNFNQHRLAVIRYVIEKNLSIAIANYNSYSSSLSTDFQMPRLKETDWEKILNNISMISFLQGLNIGGKIYNGYSIINNNKNEELVAENSIYIVTNDNNYHRPTETGLETKNIVTGIFNIDVERKEVLDTDINNYPNADGSTRYYYPKRYMACYDCIVNSANVEEIENIYEYMEGKGNLAKTYYTALARERYSTYKIARRANEFRNTFR